MTETEARTWELREAQLRHRIAVLTDQRDFALATCDRLRARLDYWRGTAQRLRQGRDLWRYRATRP